MRNCNPWADGSVGSSEDANQGIASVDDMEDKDLLSHSSSIGWLEEDARVFPYLLDRAAECWDEPQAHGIEVEWAEHASRELQEAMKKDMLIRSMDGMEAASSDIARDVKVFPHWMDFANGSTTSTNGENGLFDSPELFPSFEPVFRAVERFHDKRTLRSRRNGSAQLLRGKIRTRLSWTDSEIL